MNLKDQSKIQDVAIIMDGNGRWAKNRSRPRIWGHVRGASVVSKIAESASDLELNSLTLYAFSTENFSRPDQEVNFLFKLLDKFLIKEKQKILKNNIHFRVIGKFDFLSEKTLRKVRELEDLTKDNTGLKLRFAFGYGGRAEIVEACNTLISKNLKASEENISKHLYDEIINIDLLIRTGGDQRISNFLLWQSAYAELFFTNTFWPDFSSQEFQDILSQVSTRERRFGGIHTSSETEFQKENQTHL